MVFKILCLLLITTRVCLLLLCDCVFGTISLWLERSLLTNVLCLS